jgi:ribosomal protein L35
MPKLKTKKTAAKRFKKTKPRGGKGAKILYKKSKEGHLRTKKTSRRKSRALNSHTVSDADHERISKMITS